jgi:hypothetical protein
MVTKYLRLIDAECNERDAFDFELETLGVDSRTRRIGHLTRFSFPFNQTEMVQDLSLTNPENPNVKDPAVGVFSYIFWEGTPDSSIDFHAKISPRNKAVMQEAFFSSMDEFPVMELEFVIYDYDYLNKKYFKRFYNLDTPVKCILREGYSLNLNEDPDFNKKPLMITLSGSLMLLNGAENQKVGFAFSSTGPKFTRETGESCHRAHVIEFK